MAVYHDPGADPARDKRRAHFADIRDFGTYDDLMAFIGSFVAHGHDPDDARDGMYEIMGVTPDYLDFLKHELKVKSLNANLAFSKVATRLKKETEAQHGHGHARNKRLGLSVAPEDE